MIHHDPPRNHKKETTYVTSTPAMYPTNSDPKAFLTHRLDAGFAAWNPSPNQKEFWMLSLVPAISYM